MSCFCLRRWVNMIDKLMRDFIWMKNEAYDRGEHLLNWITVCLPKDVRVFGVKDLTVHNIALLLRW